MDKPRVEPPRSVLSLDSVCGRAPDLDHSRPVTLLVQEVLLKGRQAVQMVLRSLHIVLKHRRPFLQ